MSDWEEESFSAVDSLVNHVIGRKIYGSREAFRDLQDRIEATLRELETAKASLAETTRERDALREERDSLRGKAGKSLTPTERNTLLTIIAALCKNLEIETGARGAAKEIAALTEHLEINTPVSDDTVRRVLGKIPDALETRKR